MRNRGQSCCKEKISPDDFKSIATLSFHKMLTGNDGDYFTQWEKSEIQNFKKRHLTIAFDFKEPAMI